MMYYMIDSYEMAIICTTIGRNEPSGCLGLRGGWSLRGNWVVDNDYRYHFQLMKMF